MLASGIRFQRVIDLVAEATRPLAHGLVTLSTIRRSDLKERPA